MASEPKGFEGAADACEQLRTDMLFHDDEYNLDTGCLVASHHAVLALAALETAAQHFRLAQHHEARELAREQTGRRF